MLLEVTLSFVGLIRFGCKVCKPRVITGHMYCSVWLVKSKDRHKLKCTQDSAVSIIIQWLACLHPFFTLLPSGGCSQLLLLKPQLVFYS